MIGVIRATRPPPERVILSLTEGPDQPIQTPPMFRASTLGLADRVGLLPHLRLDVERVEG